MTRHKRECAKQKKKKKKIFARNTPGQQRRTEKNYNSYSLTYDLYPTAGSHIPYVKHWCLANRNVKCLAADALLFWKKKKKVQLWATTTGLLRSNMPSAALGEMSSSTTGW